MPDIDFHRTPMGRDFYDRTMPALVTQLRLLNENLAKIVKLVEDKQKETNGPVK